MHLLPFLFYLVNGVLLLNIASVITGSRLVFFFRLYNVTHHNLVKAKRLVICFSNVFLFCSFVMMFVTSLFGEMTIKIMLVTMGMTLMTVPMILVMTMMMTAITVETIRVTSMIKPMLKRTTITGTVMPATRIQ